MKRALVVDDTDVHRTATRSFLVMSGFAVETASDGLQALHILDTQPFDLIVSDLEMPNMNGLEFLRRAKKHKNAEHTPIIMLSTVNTEEVKQKVQQLGGSYYLVKPFSAESIKTALKAVGVI